MAFSFYYTEKIALIVLSKNPLMQTIESEKTSYEIGAVNALIDGDYIIPGINGLTVNTKESYYNMQELEVFNEYYLVFDQVKPEISLADNKDKIIKQGNKKNNQVSLILEASNEVSEYLRQNEYKASLLINASNYEVNSYFEVINNEVDDYSSLEKTLTINKVNTHICVINANNYDICLESGNYLVEPTLILNNTNYIEVKNSLDRGSIIMIDKNALLEEVKLLLKEIRYKNYEVVYLSELISEENNTKE